MKMKKFINKPEDLTDELLEGMALANPDIIELQPNHLVVNKNWDRTNELRLFPWEAPAMNRAAQDLPVKACWISVLSAIFLLHRVLSPVSKLCRKQSVVRVFSISF